ncbi:hypothetical protein O181_102178 [Austropuccinia psidii MF-1]|uniref:Uncharacterized protein n=1 Tax=Austropuccinia psidii MF-1 TaxID=1389203 RepID=A0A9Q3JFW1_9BASI|nr:hypothetical protein [Austropuccinia psidii MF-1]
MEGEAPSRRSRSFSDLLGGYPSISQGPRSRLGEAEDEEGDESLEGEEYEETEVEAAFAGTPEAPEVQNLALSNQPLVSQDEPNFLKMMEQWTQFMGQLTEEVISRDNPRVPAFKTTLMRESDSFDGTKAYKLRGFIQPCQLIFHNDPENFFSDKKKVLYSTSFLAGRAKN